MSALRVSVEVEAKAARGLTPTEIRDKATCPYCKALPGVPCRKVRGGERKANHLERVQLARSYTR